MVSMKEVTLASGEKLTVDTNFISIKEYRSLFDPKQTDVDEYEIIGKIIGKTGEQVSGLGQMDYRRVLDAVIKAAGEPLTDPT